MKDSRKQELVVRRKEARREYWYGDEGSAWRSFKCFWTRPLGHKYVWIGPEMDDSFCVSCGKRVDPHGGLA